MEARAHFKTKCGDAQFTIGKIISRAVGGIKRCGFLGLVVVVISEFVSHGS